MMTKMKLTDTRQASRFGEGYPVGNGQMGAVVYGSFPVEKLVLTENTFYSGRKSEENNQPGAKDAFYRMREYITRENYEAAHKEAEKFHGIRNDYGTNLPVGNLEITFEDMDETASYERSLDFQKGIAEVDMKVGHTCIHTETFASHPHHVLVWHMESTGPVDLTAGFRPYHENGQTAPADQGFLYTAKAIETVHCGNPCGVSLYGRCLADTDGVLSTEGGGLKIQGASGVTLYLICRTDYEWQMSENTPLEHNFGERAWEELENHTNALLKNDFRKIRSDHEQDISRIMSRVDLQMEGNKACEAAELFQYGRYLLLSSSREDSLLPAHLQGIWNDDVACRIGWSCDMHLDINTQMNYFPSDVTNMPETLPPVLHWMKLLAQEGRKTAREAYGLEGWSAELVSNAWCYTAPYWAVPLSPYPTGGAWLLSQLWEHCDYAGDTELLKSEIYPLMKGAVEFFTGYVFEDEKSGQILSGPSVSAENSFVSQGKTYQLSNGCTYEITVIRELFENFLKVCRTIEKEEPGAADKNLITKVQEILPGLPGFRVMPDGTLAEWTHDFPSSDPQHRHTSHLMGLFPFAQITPDKTPDLAQAASKTIEAKLNPYEQWEDTGWARSLLLLYEARLHNGEKAWFHVKSMLDQLREPNGMIYHPPTRGTVFDDDFGHVYELDGNTGFTSGIAEMLLQSHDQIIRLLPAVPKEWREGHVKGLKARGGVTVEIVWRDGRVVEYRLISQKDQKCRVMYNNKVHEADLIKDKMYIWKE
ncbi:MAG: glycoside hydrolase family 95 protein [Eubacteriales bacterium]|nr:glycoside hydrolase family 95 protein [Eubacteriales bacterium]